MSMNKILLYVNVALILTVSVLSYWLNNVREEKNAWLIIRKLSSLMWIIIKQNRVKVLLLF